MSNPVRWFIDINKKCFEAVAKLFPNTKISIDKYYSEYVRENLRDNITILDIGGGKTWHFREQRKNFSGLRVIALDPSEKELSYNHDVDEKIIFAMGIDARAPLDDNSVDIVTSHMVLEHIPNNNYTMREISRILKPGGKFISAFPCKFAIFAIINQMLPNWLARKILFAIHPNARFGCEFKFAFNYNQSWYFSFFLPFGLIALAWDLLMYIFHVKPLCGYLCFSATKK